MRRILYISIIILFPFAMLACRDGIPKLDKAKEVRVDFQSSFKDDIVKVVIDGIHTYSDTVTTNPILGLAGSIPISLSKTKHGLHISVNNLTSTLIISAHETEVVMVRYDRDKQKITAQITDQPIYYY